VFYDGCLILVKELQK